MISALKHIIVFVTLQRHQNDGRGVKIYDIFHKFYLSKIVFYLQFLLACFENKMFTIIRNGSLKWVVMRKNVKNTNTNENLNLSRYSKHGYWVFLNRVDLRNLNQITEYKKLQID